MNVNKNNPIDLTNGKIYIHGSVTEEIKIQTSESSKNFVIFIYLPSSISPSQIKFYPKGKDFEILYERDVIYSGSFDKWIRVTESSLEKTYNEINHFITIFGEFTEYNPRVRY